MGELIFRLLVMVPLVGGLAYLSLWLWRKTQLGGAMTGRMRSINVTDSVSLGPGCRLLVVEFDGRKLLLSASRQGTALLAQAEIIDA